MLRRLATAARPAARPTARHRCLATRSSIALGLPPVHRGDAVRAFQTEQWHRHRIPGRIADADGAMAYSSQQPDPKGGMCATGADDSDNAQDLLEKYAHPSLDALNIDGPPRRFSEYSNEALGIMAGQGIHGAFKERLLREIMLVDQCSYREAYRVLGRMNTVNEQGMWLKKLPYITTISTTVTFTVLTVPAVFHRDFAMWFCATFVKEDLPDPATLDTMWKVGAWTWTWMEPAIGTASVVLLALQLVRSHMQKIDLKPYHGLVSSWRADRLTAEFPQYEREIVRDYAKSDLWARDTNKARMGFPANSVIPPRGL